MGTHYGVDVSHYQDPTAINWRAMNIAGVEFAVIKYTQGTTTLDPSGAAHNTNVKATGMKTHAYHYFLATTVAQAQAEAAYFIAAVKANPVSGYLFLDVEDATIQLTPSVLTANINAFLSALEAAGYKNHGVYANYNWFTNYITMSALNTNTKIWLARYNTITGMNCDMWQNTSTGTYTGYTGNLDCDIAYFDGMVNMPATTPDNGTEANALRYPTFQDLPAWAKPTVKKLMDSAVLVGDGNGVIDLSYDMARSFVINDRESLYK